MDNDLITRLDASVDIISEHINFRVGDFVIGKSANKRIHVYAYTKYVYKSSLKNIDVKPEFDLAKAAFLEVYASSTKFKHFIKEEDIDYYLQFDYGGGSITLCKEERGLFAYEKIYFNDGE